MNRRSLKIAVPTAALLLAGAFGLLTATEGSAGSVPILPPDGGGGGQVEGPEPQRGTPAPPAVTSRPATPGLTPSPSPSPPRKPRGDGELCSACA
jgi:hypothetical protein